MNIQSTREKLGRRLADVSEVAAGVLRGVRRSSKRDVATYVFDMNNHLPSTVGGLSSYLDEVMGPAYFDKDASPDLRWNSYLYFVVDEAVASNPTFHATKANLEADRSYARKFVVLASELDRVLEELDSIAVVDKVVSATDVIQAWSDALSVVGLEDVLDGDRPLADVVRSVSSGTAKQSVRAKKSTGVDSSRKLVASHLASLDLTNFRSHPKRRVVDGFGKANLIFGSNGVGKTSLLEGIEFLYCGANRRSEASIGTAVHGKFASGETIQTSSQQLLSDFKTRQRLWYGGDDNSRQNKLPNQFARFNFLNTDAAAELSLFKEDTKAGNADSLAALLSGQEASLMWRRIQDARKAVSEEIRSKRSERALAESEHKASENERLALEAVPVQSDAAFSVFIKDLERIGWRNAPDNKQGVNEQLAEALSDATSQLNVIRKLEWIPQPLNRGSIAKQASVLNKASEDVRVAYSRVKEDRHRRDILVQRKASAESRLAGLSAISPAALIELNEFSTAVKSADNELAQSARMLAALPTDIPPDGWEATWGHRIISEAKLESDTKFRDISKQHHEAKQRLLTMASAQSHLQREMAELHSLAKKVIAHGHLDSSCPVCATKFETGELLQRMQSLALTPPDAAITELRLHIDQLDSLQARASKDSSWLGQLEKFLSTVANISVPTTVRDAQQAVTALKERQQRLMEGSKAAKDGLAAYARVGLSFETIESLCMPVDGDDIAKRPPLDVIGARQRVEEYIQQVQDVISELDERILHGEKEVRHHLDSMCISAGDSFEIAIEELLARQRIVVHADEVCNTLHHLLVLESHTGLNSLLTSLDAAVLGARKVLAAVRTDNDSTCRLDILRTRVTELTDRLGRIGDAIERLIVAQRVLGDVIANHSLDAATAAVVAAMHKVADGIFGRIHAPAEYMVTADAETPLKRRDNNLAVQLDQVSTGQRAAYALSMFLAMNAQVKDGPALILLDDPISHIDDLNALSFMDYLRNLVLKSDRQVFFATADEKVAGLFAHKFGFLGDEFRTIELTRI